MIRIVPLRNDSLKSWCFRLLMGPAMLADGIINTLTLSFVSAGLTLECSRLLAKARIERMTKSC